MKTVLVFDFDGTLADTYAYIFKIERELAEEYDIPKITYDEGMREQRLVHMLKGHVQVSTWKLPGLLKKAKRRFTEDMEKEVSFFEGTKSLIDQLKEEYPLYIISSNFSRNPKEHIQMVLDREDIPVFKNIYTIPLLKGKTQAFRKFCNEEGINKEDVIYIADEISDAETCKELGITFIGVSWGYNSEHALKEAGAERIAHTHKELLQLISEIHQ